MTRRRIQPKAAVELETVSLRLPVELVRAVEQDAKYLGGSRTAPTSSPQGIEIALEEDKGFQNARPGRPPRRPAPSAPPRSRRVEPPAEQRHRRRGAIRPAGVVP